MCEAAKEANQGAEETPDGERAGSGRVDGDAGRQYFGGVRKKGQQKKKSPFEIACDDCRKRGSCPATEWGRQHCTDYEEMDA